MPSKSDAQQERCPTGMMPSGNDALSTAMFGNEIRGGIV
jgi:hypothetical protein